MTADEDLAASQSTIKLKAAAALLGATGTFTLIMGAQLVLLTFVEAWLNLLAYGWLALGVLFVYLAAMVLRARAWATFGGAAVGLLATLATTGWAIYAALGGMLSCVGFLVIPVAFAATVVSVLALGDARRATAARARLADAGMDLGL